MRKTITICLIILMIYCLYGCVSQTGDNRSSETVDIESSNSKIEKEPKPTSEEERALNAYSEFMNDNSTLSKDGAEVNVYELLYFFSGGDYPINYKYAIVDITNDGIPDLILSGGKISNHVLTYKDGNLTLLWTDEYLSDYSIVLNNGGILHIREGTAPPHTNYEYLTLNSDGSKREHIWFAKYDSYMGETDPYFEFDENGLSEDEWIQRTQPYLSIGEIEWNEYWGDDSPVSYDAEKETYIRAYTDFLLNADMSDDNGFPIYEYHLFDMDFDGIPELGLEYFSGGSMGAYFTYYRFDGEKIVAVLNDKGLPARASFETQMLADYKNKNVYLLKELYGLQGNENGIYGYLREIISQDGIPCVYDVLSIEVNQESDLEKHYEKHYGGEDDYLLDDELAKCFITQYCSGGEWKDITSEDYLKRKRELIPVDNAFVNLRGTVVYIHLYNSPGEFTDENGNYKNIRITAEQINALFSKWLKYNE